MASASRAAPHQLATLRRLLDRWVVDYPTILEIDPERARHHADAIEDLRRVIARFEEHGVDNDKTTMD